MPCCLPFGKAGGLQILCCQGFEVNDYNFTLDALALKPSGFCNVRVKTKSKPLDLFKKSHYSLHVDIFIVICLGLHKINMRIYINLATK